VNRAKLRGIFRSWVPFLNETGVPTEIDRRWLGPLSSAPPALAKRLRDIPSFAALAARGWDDDRTLVCLPRKKEGYDLDIFVVGRMFSWDAQSPVIWIFSTIGLCAVEQPRRDSRQGFEHFELVLATSNSETEDPFPARLGVVLSQGRDGMPGWDWDQVAHPPLLEWLEIVAQELGLLVQAGSHFAIGDALTMGPGNSGWTRSVLSHSVLLSATPHMLVMGLAPFDKPGAPVDTVKPKDWFQSPGTGRFEYGFYWLLPVTQQEHDKALREGTWEVFADLVELAPKEQHDSCTLAFDLLRGARR
jgi:hypothetical protein